MGMIRGNRQMMISADIPEETKRYTSKVNKRKSNNALPPFSCVYSDILFE
jgi:hypothetical protein